MVKDVSVRGNRADRASIFEVVHVSSMCAFLDCHGRLMRFSHMGLQSCGHVLERPSGVVCDTLIRMIDKTLEAIVDALLEKKRSPIPFMAQILQRTASKGGVGQRIGRAWSHVWRMATQAGEGAERCDVPWLQNVRNGYSNVRACARCALRAPIRQTEARCLPSLWGCRASPPCTWCSLHSTRSNGRPSTLRRKAR